MARSLAFAAVIGLLASVALADDGPERTIHLIVGQRTSIPLGRDPFYYVCDDTDVVRVDPGMQELTLTATGEGRTLCGWWWNFKARAHQHVEVVVTRK